jgi:tRNA U55 pseudouridine synthase TruB
MTGAGACLQALRRTRSGEFTLAEAVSLQDLTGSPEDAARRALPLDRLLASTPAARLTDEGRRHVSHGQETAAWTAAHEPAVPSVAERSEAKAEQVATAGWVRLVDSDGHLVAMARPGTRPGFLHPEVVLI